MFFHNMQKYQKFGIENIWGAPFPLTLTGLGFRSPVTHWVGALCPLAYFRSREGRNLKFGIQVCSIKQMRQNNFWCQIFPISPKIGPLLRKSPKIVCRERLQLSYPVFESLQQQIWLLNSFFFPNIRKKCFHFELNPSKKGVNMP